MTKILIVDDDESIRDIFSTVLQKAGYDVILAVDGKDGIEKAKAGNVNLILLDQILPDMNGNQVLQILKTGPKTSTVPIAIVSNYSQDSIIQEAIRNGATDYIMKYQIDTQDILQKVEQLLRENPSQGDGQTTVS